MPELPEVETTISELKPEVEGKRITRVEIFSEKQVATPPVEEFIQGLVGRMITGLERRGKYLIFRLDDGKVLIIHLRMTGSLLIKPKDETPEKAIRAMIFLDNGKAIHFRDIRRFGRMWLVNDESAVVGKLGPEPLDPEFTPELLKSIINGRRTPIKSLLMDQSLIAGIGNMYADEALFYARIHPLQPANSLTAEEIQRLHAAIREVLRLGIQNRGASTDTYIRPAGIKGGAQLEFRVAHQKGKACPVCGGPIERIVVQQRGTFFCPRCQRLN